MLPPDAVAKPIESKSTARGERVFVKDGLRSFRRTYRLGDPIQVRVQDIRRAEGKVELAPAETRETREAPRRQNRRRGARR